MDINVENIDENDKKTHRAIYEVIDEPYFGEVIIFLKLFLDHCKKHPNKLQNIHLKPRRMLKPSPEKKLCMCRCL